MEVRQFYSGIFNEEICLQFLSICTDIVKRMLQELYSVCKARRDFDSTFRDCLNGMRVWTEDTLVVELNEIMSHFPNFEDAMRSSFIIFVKSFYQRPGCPKLRIRLTSPPCNVFFSKFVSHISDHDVIRSGRFFDPDNVLMAKDCVMDLIRMSLYECVSDYVIVEELTVDANVNADHVKSEDSVSQVGINPHYVPNVEGSAVGSEPMNRPLLTSHQRPTNMVPSILGRSNLSGVSRARQVLRKTEDAALFDQTKRIPASKESKQSTTSSLKREQEGIESPVKKPSSEIPDRYDEISSVSSLGNDSTNESDQPQEDRDEQNADDASVFSKKVQEALSVVIDKTTVVNS